MTNPTTAAEWLKIPEDKLLSKLQEVLPGLQKIDWNVAMEWRDKAVAGKDSTVFANYLLEVFGGGTEGDIDECFAKAQPCDYLRAAALAAGRNGT